MSLPYNQNTTLDFIGTHSLKIDDKSNKRVYSHNLGIIM